MIIYSMIMRTMASGPITLWQIDREKVEMVTDFILLGSKITVDGDCSHEIKRLLLLRRKAMTKLDSILKRSESESHSVASDSLQPHGLYSPWNSPGQNTGVISLSLLQQILPTNWGLLHCRQILYQLSYQGSPLKSRDITLLTKVGLVKAMAFSSSYLRMSDLDNKEG